MDTYPPDVSTDKTKQFRQSTNNIPLNIIETINDTRDRQTDNSQLTSDTYNPYL